MDERVLTEHSDGPDTGSFPAVTAGGASGDLAAVPPAAAPPGAPERPATPPPPAPVSSRWSQVPYVIVLAGMLAGLGLAGQGTAQVRAGMVTVAAALLAAALARLVLPERRAGLLATRHRLIDIVTLLGFGVCLLAMALVLPRSA